VILSELTRTVYQNALLDHRALPAFLSLLRARSQLSHPHLLTLKNHFTKPQTLPAFSCENEPRTEVYIEYPYLTRTLEDLIEDYSNRGMEVPEAEVVKVFGAVGEALRFLAGEGTCHGDVKSANVLFDPTGTVKLIDSYFVNGGKTAYEIVL
jgi:serine/threonine protein kinase